MNIVPQEYLNRIENVVFGCGFVDGVCNHYRNNKRRYSCCDHCYAKVGYQEVKAQELPKEYLPHFSNPKGFLGDNGCKLPREMRSSICITYICDDCALSEQGKEIMTGINIEVEQLKNGHK